MQPRLPTSKKWTAFPKEYVEQIEGAFKENFQEQMGDRTLVIEGRIYSEEITLRVGLHSTGQLRQANFEVSINYDSKTGDAVDRIHNCIDAAASMMMDYLENEEELKNMNEEPDEENEASQLDFPRHWKAFPFQDKTVYLQFSTENTDLEAQADALLGKEEALVKETPETEDALEYAEIIPDDEESDESEGPGQPRMFGTPKKGKKRKEDLH